MKILISWQISEIYYSYLKKTNFSSRTFPPTILGSNSKCQINVKQITLDYVSYWKVFITSPSIIISSDA